MEPSLSFRFIPTKEDFIKTTRAYQLRRTETRTLLVIFSFLFLMGAIGSIVFRLNLSLGPLFTMLWLPLYLLVIFVMNPRMIGRQVDANERLRTEVTWTVDAQGVHLASKFAQVQMDWRSFQALVETREYFLLTYSGDKRKYQIVPKRAFASDAELSAFRELVSISIVKAPGAKAGPSWFVRNRVSIIIYLVLAVLIVIMVVANLAKSSH
ncbi:MAG TPA: YcxB family protein [Anaerolineales bacterium]|nr:YcxB family protein [Anaerolineales bacterium]